MTKRYDIAGHQTFKCESRVAAIAAQQGLPHVRDIEQSGMLAGVQMFFHHAKACVLHGHVMAGKGTILPPLST